MLQAVSYESYKYREECGCDQKLLHLLFTLKSEHSGGMCSIPCRVPVLECHDKGLQTQLGLQHFCNPSPWR